MRPFQIVLLASFALLAIIGLVLFTTYSGLNGSKTSVGRVSIWGTLPQDALDQAISALSASSKDYASISYKQVSAGSFSSELANAIASGSGPDMIIISQESLLAEGGKLSQIPFSSLPQRTFVNSYVPEANLFLNGSGSLGIPYVVDPLVLYYNQAILGSNGIATPPATWEAVNGIAQKVTQQTANQTVTRSAVALGTFGNIANARAIISLLLLQAGNPITQSQTQGIVSTLSQAPDSSFGAAPAQSAMDFYTQFANPAKTVYSWNQSLPNSRQAFLSGDLVLYLGFASELPYLTDANPNLNFDMAPAPQSGVAATKVSYANIYAFAIPKASANPQGAYQTALALSDPTLMALAARAMSMAPAKRAALVPATDDLYAPVFYPEALSASGWLSPAASDTDRVFAVMIDNILTGRTDTQTAISTADQSLNAALR